MTIELTTADEGTKSAIRAAIGVPSTADLDSVAATLLTPLGIEAPWGPNDAPVFIVMGQSNSYGHGTSLSTNDRVTTPLANVFSLNRNTLYKTDVGVSDVVWEGLTTLNQHNIATNSGDHTASAAKEFGRLWQAHIAGGNPLGLPNLYVIEAGWGSQGMTLGSGNDRWSPDRDSASVESLYWRVTKTVRCAIQHLKAQGKNPRIIRVHWNQWETEAWSGGGAGSDLAARANFERMLRGFNDALGADAPWAFFYPHSTTYGAYSEGGKPLNVRRSVISTVAADTVRRRLINPQLSPSWTGVAPDYGIYVADNVHYSAAVQKWFAQIEFDRVLAGNRGVVAGIWPQGSAGFADIIARLGTGGISQSQLESAVAAVETQVGWKAAQYAAGDLSTAKPLSSTAFIRVGITQKWSVVREAVSGLKVFRPSDSTGGNRQSLIAFSKAPTDSKYGTARFVAKGRAPIAVAYRVVPNTVNSFQGLGYGYAALAFHDFDATAGNSLSGRCVFWQLATSSVNVFSTGGFTGVLPTGYVINNDEWREWEYALLPDASGTAYIRYRAVGATNWITIYSQTGLEAAITAAGLSQGQIGLMVGLGIGTNGTTDAARWSSSYGSLNIREFEFVSAD